MTDTTNCEEFRGPEAYARYAPILQAIAEGKRVEWNPGDGNWTYQHPSHTLNEIKGWLCAPERYRVQAEPAEDFPLGKACDLSGDSSCEACQ